VTWHDAGAWVIDHLETIGKTLGLGGGVGLLKFIRRVPAPRLTNKWGGVVFDWAQDLVSNDDRIGLRVDADGKQVFVLEPRKPHAEDKLDAR
jgi:hypothetical protein